MMLKRNKLFTILISCIAMVCFSLAGIFTVKANAATVEETNPTTFAMVDGASVRKDEYAGIRFTTVVAASYDGEGKTFGTIVAPKTILDAANITAENFTHANAQGASVVIKDIPVSVWDTAKGTDAKKVYNAVLWNTPVSDYATEIVARSYVLENGVYTYTDNTVTRSCAQVAATALAEGETDSEQGTLVKYVDSVAEGVSLDKADITLGVDETVTLSATTAPTGWPVVWESSNEEVITVEDGVITAIANGEATITASFGSKVAQCTVKVVAVQTLTYSSFEANGTSGVYVWAKATAETYDSTANVNWPRLTHTLGEVTGAKINSVQLTAKDDATYSYKLYFTLNELQAGATIALEGVRVTIGDNIYAFAEGSERLCYDGTFIKLWIAAKGADDGLLSWNMAEANWNGNPTWIFSIADHYTERMSNNEINAYISFAHAEGTIIRYRGNWDDNGVRKFRLTLANSSNLAKNTVVNITTDDWMVINGYRYTFAENMSLVWTGSTWEKYSAVEYLSYRCYLNDGKASGLELYFNYKNQNENTRITNSSWPNANPTCVNSENISKVQFSKANIALYTALYFTLSATATEGTTVTITAGDTYKWNGILYIQESNVVCTYTGTGWDIVAN